MEGVIARGIFGLNGFGYDPFFYLPEYGKTSAEITEEEKNAISHRGKALRAMLSLFDAWRQSGGAEQAAGASSAADSAADCSGSDGESK